MAEKINERPIFPELYFSKEGYKLDVEGVEEVSGQQAYKLKVTAPSGKSSYRYYAKDSGLLLQTESAVSMQGMTINQVANYENYQEVNGLKFPFT